MWGSGRGWWKIGGLLDGRCCCSMWSECLHLLMNNQCWLKKKREKYLIWMYMSPNLSKISPFFQTPTSFPFVSRVLFFITIFKPRFPSIQSCTPFSAEQFFLKHWCFSTIQRQLHTFQWQGTVQYRPCTKCTTPHAHCTLAQRFPRNAEQFTWNATHFAFYRLKETSIVGPYLWWWEGWWWVLGLNGWRMCWGRRPGQQTAPGSDTNSPGQHSSSCPSDLFIKIFKSIICLPINCPQQDTWCYIYKHSHSVIHIQEWRSAS